MEILVSGLALAAVLGGMGIVLWNWRGYLIGNLASGNIAGGAGAEKSRAPNRFDGVLSGSGGYSNDGSLWDGDSGSDGASDGGDSGGGD